MGHARRSLAVVAMFWLLIAAPRRAGALPLPDAGACTPADQCCKVCDAGQACGNSCISRTKQCHKGRGCACDAVDVCARG